MTLSDWMSHKGLDDASLGELVGRDRTRISRIRRGLSLPSFELFRELHKLSKGKLTPDSFSA